MSDTLPDVVWSKRAKRVARWFLVFCILNYVVRFLSLSISAPMGWYPKDLISRMDSANIWWAVAWVEFTVIKVVLLAGSCLFLAVIVLRECVYFALKGKDGCVVTVRSVLILMTALGATLFVVFQMVVNGQGAFEGARLGGLGIHGVMFCMYVCTIGVFVVAVMFVVDPQKAQIAFDQQK